jgi:hypothetical protein
MEVLKSKAVQRAIPAPTLYSELKRRSANLIQMRQAGPVPLRQPGGMLVETPSRGAGLLGGGRLAACGCAALGRTAQELLADTTSKGR